MKNVPIHRDWHKFLLPTTNSNFEFIKLYKEFPKRCLKFWDLKLLKNILIISILCDSLFILNSLHRSIHTTIKETYNPYLNWQRLFQHYKYAVLPEAPKTKLSNHKWYSLAANNTPNCHFYPVSKDTLFLLLV